MLLSAIAFDFTEIQAQDERVSKRISADNCIGEESEIMAKVQ